MIREREERNENTDKGNQHLIDCCALSIPFLHQGFSMEDTRVCVRAHTHTHTHTPRADVAPSHMVCVTSSVDSCSWKHTWEYTTVLT